MRAGIQNDLWGTPEWLRIYVHQKYKTNPDFDPSPYPRPILPSGELYDGLQVEWDARTFVNPPFSHLTRWVKKMFQEYQKGKFICMLMPTSKTNTNYFHDYILPYAKFEFLKGRIQFINLQQPSTGASWTSPFATMLVIMDPHANM